jgi:hypothetical protein
MIMAWRFAFGILQAFDPVRQVLSPFLISIFLRILNSEFLPRFFLLILSVSEIIGMYLFVKETYNNSIGIIGAFFCCPFFIYIYFLHIDY